MTAKTWNEIKDAAKIETKILVDNWGDYLQWIGTEEGFVELLQELEVEFYRELFRDYENRIGRELFPGEQVQFLKAMRLSWNAAYDQYVKEEGPQS